MAPVVAADTSLAHAGTGGGGRGLLGHTVYRDTPTRTGLAWIFCPWANTVMRGIVGMHPGIYAPPRIHLAGNQRCEDMRRSRFTQETPGLKTAPQITLNTNYCLRLRHHSLPFPSPGVAWGRCGVTPDPRAPRVPPAPRAILGMGRRPRATPPSPATLCTCRAR